MSIRTDIFPDLTSEESDAFLAWFGGGFTSVTKIEGRSHVVFGKAECEHVDFEEVWLGKFVKLGLITVVPGESYTCKGIISRPQAVKYQIKATDKGWDARESYWDATS